MTGIHPTEVVARKVLSHGSYLNREGKFSVVSIYTVLILVKMGTSKCSKTTAVMKRILCKCSAHTSS